MLDIKILVVISFVTLIITTIINLILIYYFPKNKIFKYLLGFNLGFMIGQFLMILRNIAPDFFSIVVGNGLLVVGHICLYIAVRGILKQDMQWHFRYFIPIIVVVVGLFIYTYIYYDTEMRIIIFSLFCVIYGIAIAQMFWEYASKELFFIHKLTSVFFLFSAIIFLIRTYKASRVELPVNYLSITDLMIVVPYVYLIFITIWICILTLLEVNEEQKELKQRSLKI